MRAMWCLCTHLTMCLCQLCLCSFCSCHFSSVTSARYWCMKSITFRSSIMCRQARLFRPQWTELWASSSPGGRTCGPAPRCSPACLETTPQAPGGNALGGWRSLKPALHFLLQPLQLIVSWSIACPGALWILSWLVWFHWWGPVLTVGPVHCCFSGLWRYRTNSKFEIAACFELLSHLLPKQWFLQVWPC